MACDLIFYLRQHFPTLTIDGGLFYRWPIGIRFDLGGRACTAGALSEVKQRAIALFEAVFPPEDSCIIVAQNWPGDHEPPDGLTHLLPFFEFAHAHAIGLGEPDGRAEVQETGESEINSHTLTWIKQAAREFLYGPVFEGIANADHARAPAISSRVYFINPQTNVILHMYDDRGLDLIAEQKDSLEKLYNDFNSWILDYDRARIDELFR